MPCICGQDGINCRFPACEPHRQGHDPFLVELYHGGSRRAADLIASLTAKLHASEKRAESAEAERDRLRGARANLVRGAVDIATAELQERLTTAERERDEARANSEAVLDQWRGEITKSEKRAAEAECDKWRTMGLDIAAKAEAVERERDEALKRAEEAEELLVTAENQRDSAESSLARVVEARDSLFAAIQHGDDVHREWLNEAIDAHFAGKPVPPTRSALHRSQGE